MISQRQQRVAGYVNQWLREMKVGDVLISRLVVVDCEMRIGIAVVRMGGIGDVHTEPEHRMKGHMAQFMPDTVKWMAQQGYDCSLLFGIHDFYHRFGYAVCLAEPRITIPTRDSERAEAVLQTRAAQPQDFPAILGIYNDNNRTRTCSLVRPADWPAFRHGSEYYGETDAVVVTDAGGQVVGYAAIDRYQQRATIAELGAREGASQRRIFSTLMRAFAEVAIERRCGEISICLPLDHPFAIFARRFGYSASANYPRNGGGMGRIINLQSLFQKLLPELNRRLSEASPGQDQSGSLSLVTEIGTIGLSVTGDQVSLDDDSGATARLQVPQAVLTQLLLGYRTVDDVLADPEVKMKGEALPILQLLPCRDFAYMWKQDHF